MGVRVDKYLGYVVDIQEAWKKLSDNDHDKWLEDGDTELDNFSPYYGREDVTGKITILNDGMNGEYTKLIFVLDRCPDTDDSDEDIVQSVNKIINNTEVPDYIMKPLREVYRKVFNVEHVTELKVQLEYFIHWS